MGIKLSVTIVAYNNYNDIVNAITTIEKYTSNSISKHIYIVDNSVMDNAEQFISVEQFKNFLSNYADVEYLATGKNLGFGKGHNFVISRLDSEYHALVNPDILLNSDAFTTILEYLENNLDVGMCIPNIINENGERANAYRKELTVFDMFIRMFCGNMFAKRQAAHTLQAEDYSKPFQVPFGQGSFLVTRTQLFKELQGFDERYFMYLEDADLCRRVNEKSKFMYFPEASVIHKWEKGSHKKLNLFKVHLQSTFYYFRKWGIKLF